MSDQPTPRGVVDHLDAALVILCVIILAGVLWVLAFIHVPQENLPVLAGISSGVVGSVIGTYTGYRWGASEAPKRGPAIAPAPVPAPAPAAVVEPGQ